MTRARATPRSGLQGDGQEARRPYRGHGTLPRLSPAATLAHSLTDGAEANVEASDTGKASCGNPNAGYDNTIDVASGSAGPRF